MAEVNLMVYGVLHSLVGKSYTFPRKKPHPFPTILAFYVLVRFGTPGVNGKFRPVSLYHQCLSEIWAINDGKSALIVHKLLVVHALTI